MNSYHTWDKIQCEQRYVMPLILYLFTSHPDLQPIFRLSSCFCCGVQDLEATSESLIRWAVSDCQHEPRLPHSYKLTLFAREMFGPPR